ncbi:MAG: phenylalanine--tRNA ligase subunit alpha, partial [Planctomycetales bacterium]|nr:phenylalanine--tRNA ligase subunit alpha [Planctomycetales bacterium]
MGIAEFLADLDLLLTEGAAAFDAATADGNVEAARIEFLGAKSGRLKAAQQGLGKVDKQDKPAAGKRFNEVKQALEQRLAAAQQRLSEGATTADDAGFDPTVPGERLRLGHMHPITQTIDELKDIMGRLGFTPAEGPEIEDERHNFEALNIPLIHPARDPLDNFYLAVAGRGGDEQPI